MGLEQSTIEAFLNDAQSIAKKVSHIPLLKGPSEPGGPCRATDIVQKTWVGEAELRAKQGLLHRTLGFAGQLLQLTDTEIKTLRSGEDERESGEYFMELATTAHLALYFLGFHFGHLWERVRSFAQEKFAFPEGICVYKGNGDIYRRTRQLHLRLDHGHGQPPDEATVLVYTREPAFLTTYQEVVVAHDRARLPAELYGLSYLYNLFQFYLYASEGLPIRYILQREALKGMLEKNAKEVHSLICTLFPVSRQRMDIRVTRESDAGVAPCVLGYRRGFHRSGSNAVVLTESSLHTNLRNDFAAAFATSVSLRTDSWQELRELVA